MSDQAKQTPLIELARSVPKNLHSEWAIQFSEDGHATGHSMAPVGYYLHELADRVESLEKENAALRELLRRYRTETPLGHQPHMIAAKVDALLPPTTDKGE